jgi:hypothetical protein
VVIIAHIDVLPADVDGVEVVNLGRASIQTPAGVRVKSLEIVQGSSSAVDKSGHNIPGRCKSETGRGLKS